MVQTDNYTVKGIINCHTQNKNSRENLRASIGYYTGLVRNTSVSFGNQGVQTGVIILQKRPPKHYLKMRRALLIITIK